MIIANDTAIAAANAAVDLIDVGSTNAAGEVRIYDGTVPTDADTALSGNTLLATLVMSNPAFGAAADAAPGATATASAITDDSSADATGTASFFRIVDRDEATILQGTVGTSGADLNLNTVSIVTAAVVSITSMTYTQPES